MSFCKEGEMYIQVMDLDMNILDLDFRKDSQPLDIIAVDLGQSHKWLLRWEILKKAFLYIPVKLTKRTLFLMAFV